MLRHKNIERVCLIILAVMLLVTAAFLALAAAGFITEDTGLHYEARLFDQNRVHTIDISMDDWDGFLETATGEEYAACRLTIDGEVYKNVAIRAKGNTSLSSVKQYGNDRYSFKVEFDHYQSGMTYHGLDKLSLNNLIQDNTYLKDYTAYTLMGKMDVAAPLCSFVQISVNGEPWGLYLAVEGVEDSFLTRNYGRDYGELYKPDSMSFGGGRGNGREFDAEKMMEQFGGFPGGEMQADMQGGESAAPQTPPFGNMPDMSGMPPAGDMPDINAMPSPPQDGQTSEAGDAPQSSSQHGETRNRDGGPMGGFGGMGSSDVKLVYTDDQPESYANIFGNAKTDVSKADQARLIASLKALGEGDTSVVDTDAVIRYMAVHNFLCNDDSYTGMMVHNYYLYEEDGVMEMIPWDYNLSMGGFSGGDATSTVNTGVDDLVSMGGGGDRPMADWILSGEESAAMYHAMYQTFIDTVFESGWFEQELTRVIDMISPYVAADPTAFCSYEEFETASQTLLSFCLRRAESVSLQLSGKLAATSAEQSSAQKVDASDLNLRAMGGMNGMGGGGSPGKREDGFSGRPEGGFSRERPASHEQGENFGRNLNAVNASESDADSPDAPASRPERNGFSPEGFTPPDGFRQSDPSAPPSSQAPAMLAACTVTLLAALVFAKRCKSHQ